MTTARIPPLNALRALACLAQTGGVGLAAQALGVTHAAVSHHLRNLEDWFGVPLVRRNGRNIELTAEGLRLAGVTRLALDQIADTCRDIEDTARRPELTIACVPSFATRWLIPRLVDFSEAAPAIRLRLLYAPHGPRPDADIVIDWYEDPSEVAVAAIRLPLLSGHTQPVCSPAHLQRHGPFDKPADFARARLLHDEKRSDWRIWLAENGLARELADTGPVFQDFNLLVSAVVAGHGVALCVASLIDAELARGDLIPLTDRLSNRARAYWLTVDAQPTPAARQFIDWIGTRLPDAGPAVPGVGSFS
ncbi:LysR family transcriptional regulator [Stappia sp. F7233]|uniref:LysR family transcriptional regulator n=1 Tax=Stappia albiluteola TaxID=2758565 RepID=A0A839ADB1_9HYPH|nr:LysR substrate-binding domain-containing protein [Stappia albiluteola]MBA5777663.1 LysR family transcriptional regulator [Stappia albiluteola]